MTHHSGTKRIPVGRRRRGPALRMASAGLASVLAFALPVDGIRKLFAEGPATAGPPGATALPAGGLGPAPDVKTPLETKIWAVVSRQCARFGLSDKAVTMYHVLWEESRLVAKARSACGRYHGICQFTLPTFRRNVAEMRRMGLAAKNEAYSPFDPEHAIEVMAWMWSQGQERQWRPYRRVVRRLAGAQLSARLSD